MTINLLLITSIAVLTGALAYLSIFLSQRNKFSRVIIAIIVIVQLALTVYKALIDERLQKDLVKEGINLNWVNGYLTVNNSNKTNLVSSNNTSIPTSTITNPPLKDTVQFRKEIPDVDMPASECLQYGINLDYCFGRYNIVNHFPEKVLLYKITSGFLHVDCSVLISPNEIGTTPLLRSGPHDNKGNCLTGSEEYKFYFKTVSSDTAKFGSISLSTHACKIRTTSVDQNNMYLAIDGEKISN